jgi:LysR family transcriptional regulator, transcriptional activator of nhaA
MKPWINYHHLYYFKTIAESEGISRAAEKLRLGQPTLSAQLKQFEENLGVQLFERKHKKLHLTEHGHLALEYARTIFRAGEEMYEALHDRLQPSKVNVQIGALDSVPKQMILQLSQNAYQIGRCSVSLVEDKFENLVRDLISHKLDLMISNILPWDHANAGIFHRVLSKRVVGIYGGAKFKSLRADFPYSLEGHPFVMPSPEGQARYDVNNWLMEKNLKVDVICETQDIALKKLFAVNELALITAASHAVRRQVYSGELIEIGTMETVFEDLYLIAADRKIENPIASELMRSFNL